MLNEADSEQSQDFSLVTILSSVKMRWPNLSQLTATKAEVLPDSICPVCLNLGNEVWDPDYRKRHGLGSPGRHFKSTKEVFHNAKQGCSGCEVIAWALEPYRSQIERQNDRIFQITIGDDQRDRIDSDIFSRNLVYGGCGVRKDSAHADVVVVIRRTHHEPGEGTSPRSKGGCYLGSIDGLTLQIC